MKQDLSQIVRPLLNWYAESARELPWREEPSPYRVWVSEIMLQQTRVETVKPYFERFLGALPDISALAEAPEEQLLKLWQGLGYYSRVRNLQKAARAVVEQCGGKLPDDTERLKKLPGIGDYTAGAIASIAYGKPEPAVDGNVLRVMMRLTGSEADIADPVVKKLVADELRGVYPAGETSEFTQALMELGATVCLPNGEPLCGACPLAFFCRGLANGNAASLPVKTAKPTRKVEQKTVFLLLCGPRVAVRKRPEKGLLAGMWEFPNVPGELSADDAERVLKEWGTPPQRIERTPGTKHIFTHVEWNMAGYLVHTNEMPKEFEWASAEELQSAYALPSAFKSFLNLLREQPDYDKI